jgi:hypothetical protein
MYGGIKNMAVGIATGDTFIQNVGFNVKCTDDDAKELDGPYKNYQEIRGKGSSVYAILGDKEGGYWIGKSNKGAYDRVADLTLN